MSQKVIGTGRNSLHRKNRVKLNLWCWAFVSLTLIFYLLFKQSFTAVTPANIFYYLLLFLIPTLISAFGANRR